MLNEPPSRRILLVDDTADIHQDFRKLLMTGQAEGLASMAALDEMEAALFGNPVVRPVADGAPPSDRFELDSAFQGQEALAKVQDSLAVRRPYAMAFVDMRMPPGWDGVETVERIWQVDPRLQVVICTAYSDHSWDRVLERLDAGDQLLILKKPFDPIEVCQLATTLTAKWNMTRQASAKLRGLEWMVRQRTAQLRDVNAALRHELAERRRAAAELTVAASVFHHAPDGIIITGPRGRVISVNPAFSAISGHEPEEVVGKLATRLWCESWESSVYQAMRDALAKDGRWEGEVWYDRLRGDRALIRLSVAKVEDSEPFAGKYVCLFNDITDLRRKEEHIRHLAFHDHLTGLPNQALLFDKLDESIALAERGAESFGVLFIDLDQFKAINDTYGHDVGNLLLQEVASRLKGCLRRSDTVARIGGDEFVVLVRRITQVDGYAVVAKQIIECLSQPARITNRDLQVGVSIGIATFPEDGADAIDLMRHADAAMYAAKSSGRGTFRMFHAAMSEQVERRLELEMELRTALRDSELELMYQPKVSLVTGGQLGVEALIRWRHRRRGLLAPAEFLSTAEDMGLASDVGDWVLGKAFRDAAVWRDRGLDGIRIAVNLSAEQIQRSDLVETIMRLSGEHGFPLADLEIELTEGEVMADPEAVAIVLDRIRALGIRIAIDDFGTGYSSLAYLHRLPIDILKIDKSFVMNTDHTVSDAEIVKTIVGLGRALNLTVIAEGVETDDQARFLRSCGCTAAQGFLFARPMPADQVQVWLQARQLDTISAFGFLPQNAEDAA